VLVSADHLLGLINTVLDIAKIEAGRMEVQATTFAFTNLLDVCLATTQPLVRPGVSLETRVDPNVPPVQSDPEKVKQIVLNLLGNAAKFTESGTIATTVRRQGDDVVLTVEDTGIGISAEGLDRIFEEFQQADTSTTRKYGGTGLGLSISRHLAQLLGGTLTAASTPSAGSTFTLTLPLRFEQHSAVPDPGQPVPQANSPGSIGPDRPVVLAIDDDPDVIYLLEENLAEAGYKVVGLTDSRQALEWARDLRPLAITLDVVMPGNDGWQVLHELKPHPETRDIPVILVTIVDKKALGYQVGAAGYLVKPFDRDALLSALDRLSGTFHDRTRHRLLVVDDDPDVIDMVRQILAGTSFDVESAADGLAALEAIDHAMPDAVLLDLMMPRLDGFSVIEELRRRPSGRQIPIVVLTSRDLSQHESALLRERVSSVLRKQDLEPRTLIGSLYEAAPRRVGDDAGGGVVR